MRPRAGIPPLSAHDHAAGHRRKAVLPRSTNINEGQPAILQHTPPGDPDERREGLGAPGRPGSLAGCHHAFDELGERLDGAPIGSHLPPTRLTEIVRDWAGMGMSAEFTAAQKARILKWLRAREHHFELTDLYTDHVSATRPPSGTKAV